MWAKFQPWRATELMLAPSELLDNRRFDSACAALQNKQPVRSPLRLMNVAT